MKPQKNEYEIIQKGAFSPTFQEKWSLAYSKHNWKDINDDWKEDKP